MRRPTKKELNQNRAVADAIGALGYPGLFNLFTEMEAEYHHDPAVVLVAALSCDNLQPRTIEALPWLALRYSELDWQWVKREAQSRNKQNRLGYVIGLALRLGATSASNPERLQKLSALEEQLFEIRIDKEDSLCQKLEPSEREYLRESRPSEAKLWNLLTDLVAEDLMYTPDL